MSELVSSIALAQFFAAAVVLVIMIVIRGQKAMLFGSIALMGIAIAFLSTSSNLESVLLYGTLSPEVQAKSPSIDVQRARIAIWNIVVPLFIGGVGVNVFSAWLSEFMSKNPRAA